MRDAVPGAGTTPGHMRRRFAGAAAMCGSGLLCAVTGTPFLIAGFGWDWRWMAPVSFQALWCLAEGWSTARYRPSAIDRETKDLKLPVATGLTAMVVALVALTERFRQLLPPESEPGWEMIPLAGIVIGGLGVGFRQVAIRTLGDRFRDDVSLGERHEIETGGLYRWMAHPAEFGFALAMLGLILLCQSWIAFAFYTLALLPLTLIRVRRENRLLNAAAGTAHREESGGRVIGHRGSGARFGEKEIVETVFTQIAGQGTARSE